MPGFIRRILSDEKMEGRQKALDAKSEAKGKKQGGGMFDVIYGGRRERERRLREIEEES